nr:NADH dehydrogenase subunit 1 [Lardoglyphus konoi]
MEKILSFLSMLRTIIYLLSFLFSCVGVLLGVAFFTLVERKIMGLAHYRKGPNKVMISGLSQPISDAAKLLTKEFPKLSPLKLYMFMMGPSVAITLMLLCWSWHEYISSVLSNNLKIFTVFAIMGLTAFPFLLMSWGSNTKYALIGGYRAVAQIISYEVCLLLFALSVFYIPKSFSLTFINLLQNNLWFSVACAPTFLFWMMLCMAESNRTPFDLAEGESELVSGFNVEYGGGLFAFIFISEYGMIMFLSLVTSLLFLGGGVFTLVKMFLVCLMFIWVRCCFPRVRYDKLMMTSWKLALPYSISMLALNMWF